MPSDTVAAIVSYAILGSVISSLVTSFFSKKNIMKVFAEFESKMTAYINSSNKMMYDVADKVVTLHKKELHQDSMYTYVEDQITKHYKICGGDVNKYIAELNGSIEKLKDIIKFMEMKQMKTNMKLNTLTVMVSEVVKKMQITIDPTKLSKEEL